MKQTPYRRNGYNIIFAVIRVCLVKMRKEYFTLQTILPTHYYDVGSNDTNNKLKLEVKKANST